MDKMPLVTVVMALYRPNLTWLQEELISIHEQTYKNFQVYVCNDDPEDKYPYEIFFKKYLQEIPFKIFYNSANLGSNKTFEKLTTLVHTPYISYCDQDDKWHPNKLTVLIKLLEQMQGTLVCSDMRVIDGSGKIICNKITDIRPRQVFVEGKKQIPFLLEKNFVTGCTMLVKTDIAQKAIPFPKNMVHDHWLAFWNAIYGKIIVCRQSLIDYRLHGNNQTSVLSGIKTKNDYYYKRCFPYYLRMCELTKRDFGQAINKKIKMHLKWSIQRVRYFNSPTMSNFFSLLLFSNYSSTTSLFELLLPIIPQKVFLYIIDMIKKGII